MGIKTVALHPEGVDRNPSAGDNTIICYGSPSTRRAWIEILRAAKRKLRKPSPSTRRAWIEIYFALVDDNGNASPSTRRAWIEI